MIYRAILICFAGCFKSFGSQLWNRKSICATYPRYEQYRFLERHFACVACFVHWKGEKLSWCKSKMLKTGYKKNRREISVLINKMGQSCSLALRTNDTALQSSCMQLSYHSFRHGVAQSRVPFGSSPRAVHEPMKTLTRKVKKEGANTYAAVCQEWAVPWHSMGTGLGQYQIIFTISSMWGNYWMTDPSWRFHTVHLWVN